MKKINLSFPKADFSWIEQVKRVTDRIKYKWYFVGGIVRDSLLGLKTNDIDIVTEASPEEIESYFKEFNCKIISIGRQFGTIAIFWHNWRIEITSTREDEKCDGRHAEVKLGVSFETDSQRRDFTFNSILTQDGENFLDYQEGLEDLVNSNVRFIGNAENRIKEDYLRIFRYIRFVSYIKHHNRIFSPYPNKYDLIIKSNLMGLNKLSQERIITELEKIMAYGSANLAIKKLNELGISEQCFSSNLLYVDLKWPRDLRFIYSISKTEKPLVISNFMKKLIKSLKEFNEY